MARAGASKSAKSKATGKAPAENDVPDVYREMLADAISSSPTRKSEDGRVVKRRRVRGRVVTQGNDDTTSNQSDLSSRIGNDSEVDELSEDVQPVQQRIIQTESEDSADSDMDWEEVVPSESVKQEGTLEHETTQSGELNLILGREGHERDSEKYGRPKRKPITAGERKLRLDIHKMHVCSLMAHIYLRNRWCNDGKVHSNLKSLLTEKIVSYLNPDESQSQFQRSRSFMDGLSQASDVFRARFKITARGLSKPRWAGSSENLVQMQPPEDIDLPMQLVDFRDAAISLKASRDVGAQIFCAVLRSAGAEVRLVCSLLPLPFQPAQKAVFRQMAHDTTRQSDRMSRQGTPIQDSDSDVKSDGPASAERMIGSNGGRLRFEATGQGTSERMKRSASPEATLAKVPLRSKRPSRKPIRESKYPVYWVEAFNEAMQKWVSIDPLVTKTIAKPSKFEPPAGEPENSMSYVIAFEDDGSARDVTKRYAKAYNAKTRRDRVEVTPGGQRWWRRVLKMYRRPNGLDRDQVEDAELAAKEAAEPMPKNVQDFKDHPYYALERHLKRHEVIHPKREVGKVGGGRAGPTNTLEPIYRRRDMLMVKSTDKWYRMGREIKPGEQPLKRVPARRTRDASFDPEDQDADNAGTALYAAQQTTLYSAPPVKNGRIPKNVYGNLDVYVPSMVPPGGVHILHPEAARAAGIIGIDYADAVIGFAFKGRHGAAITKGAVVAGEYREAVEEVVKSFDDEKVRVEEERRSAEALKMWKRLLAGLRIRERIEGYDIEGERDTAMKENMEQVDEEDNDEERGGFLPDRDTEALAQPTAGGVFLPQDLSSGGLFAENLEDSDKMGDLSIADYPGRDRSLSNIDDDDSGGFLVNDGDADAEEVLREINVDESHDSALQSTKVIAARPSARITRGEEILEQASGFLREETDVEEQAEQRTQQLHGEPSQPRASDGPEKPTNDVAARETAFSNIPDAELEEAILLQQLYETGAMATPSTSNHGSITSNPSDKPNVQSAKRSEVATTMAEDHSRILSSPSPPKEEQLAGEAQGLTSSDDEKGSLLSNDPEDEDADPEWLA